MSQTIIETWFRIVDKYNIQFTHYEFELKKFIEITLYNKSSLYKVVINDLFMNIPICDMCNLLKTKLIKIKDRQHHKFITILCNKIVVIKLMYEPLKTLNSEQISCSYNHLKRKFIKFISYIFTVFNCNQNSKYKLLQSKQNDLIITSFNTYESNINYKSIKNKLTQLQNNEYSDIESLITTTINKTIITTPNLIVCNNELIEYIEYIITLDYPLNQCFEFVKKCYILKISNNKCMYHAGLLDLYLNKLDYDKFNIEFIDYLHNLKVLNLYMINKISNIQVNSDIFMTQIEKTNIMSLFQFIVALALALAFKKS